MARTRILTWLKRALLTLVLLVVLALAAVYAGSEWLMRRGHDVPLPSFAAPGAGVDLEEGRRKAVLVGCLEGCHGKQGEGGEEKAEGVFRISAPTLSAELAKYSDAELVRLVRYGVKRDGVTALGMPSETFYPLGDADLALVVAHLRSRPALPERPRVREITLIGRIAMLLGEWPTSADRIDPARPRWGELPLATPWERGRYLASVTCAECHGVDFAGVDYLRSPNLKAIVKAYSLDQFRHLLRTGQGLGGRDLKLMSQVARNAFKEFRDDEIADMHEFLSKPEASTDGGGQGR